MIMTDTPLSIVEIQKNVREILDSEILNKNIDVKNLSTILGSRLTSYIYDLIIAVCHEKRTIGMHRAEAVDPIHDLDVSFESVGPDRESMVQALLQLTELIATTNIPVPTSVVAQHTITDIESSINLDRITKLASDLDVTPDVHGDYVSLKYSVSSYPILVSYVAAGRLAPSQQE